MRGSLTMPATCSCATLSSASALRFHLSSVRSAASRLSCRRLSSAALPTSASPALPFVLPPGALPVASDVGTVPDSGAAPAPVLPAEDVAAAAGAESSARVEVARRSATRFFASATWLASSLTPGSRKRRRLPSRQQLLLHRLALLFESADRCEMWIFQVMVMVDWSRVTGPLAGTSSPQPESADRDDAQLSPRLPLTAGSSPKNTYGA